MTEHPYGQSTTKRLVVPAAEKALYTEHKAGTSHFVQLVDYMGGDQMIERVATAGHGRTIFPENPPLTDFLKHLNAKAIYQPFKSVHFKFRIQSSIRDALHIVYDQRASVNEYSGRYSEMIDTAFIPSVGYLKKRMKGVIEEDKEELAKKAHELLATNRQDNFRAYKEMLDTYDLARELARTPLEVDNDTTFIWKIDLLSLVNFIQEKRALKTKDSSLHAYLDIFEQIARELAPLGTEALMSESSELNLTYPTDDEVIDNTPLPPTWEAQETRRVTVPALESILFVKQDYLEDGGVQVIDYMGDDKGPVDSARISYGKGTKKVSEDQGLLRYLQRHKHTTPFECIELAVEGKTPVFVDPRQARRHRTLDAECFMGEVLVGSQYFVPSTDQLKFQDRRNRQGRGEDLEEQDKTTVQRIIREQYEKTAAMIQKARALGVDEETLRGRKGVGFYTFMWRTGDMHNWLHFLSLRMHSHAQKEIRDYANIVAEFVKRQSPTTFDALRDYRLEAVSFQGFDKPLLAALMPDLSTVNLDNLAVYEHLGLLTPTRKLKREGTELKQKLEALRDQNPELVSRIRQELKRENS